MKGKKLLFRIALLIVFIFFVNLLAMKFHWYNSIWFFDMFMHFFGGFWLGLVFLFLLKPKDFSLFLFFQISLGVLCVGLLWEVFEVVVNHTTTKNTFDFFDTISDLFFDLSGGFVSFIYFFSRIFKNSL